MKRKFNFLFLSALTIPFFMGSCSDDKEEQEVKPATDLVVDNNMDVRKWLECWFG